MKVNGLIFSNLLRLKKIKQKDIAKILKVTPASISLWGQTNRIPDKHLVMLKKIIGEGFEECLIDPLTIFTEELPIAEEVQNMSRTPYYDVDVFAGDTVNFDELLQKEPLNYFSIPHLNSDMIVNVHGDSMHNVIKSGDKIALTKIIDRSFYNYGAVHVIITKEQRLLKYLKAHNSDKNFLLLSHNDFYDPIVIPKKSVLELWIVDEVLSKLRN